MTVLQSQILYMTFSWHFIVIIHMCDFVYWICLKIIQCLIICTAVNSVNITFTVNFTEYSSSPVVTDGHLFHSSFCSFRCFAYFCIAKYQNTHHFLQQHLFFKCHLTISSQKSTLKIKILILPNGKHQASIVETSQLMLLRDEIAVYSQNRVEHINTL